MKLKFHLKNGIVAVHGIWTLATELQDNQTFLNTKETLFISVTQMGTAVLQLKLLKHHTYNIKQNLTNKVQYKRY